MRISKNLKSKEIGTKFKGVEIKKAIKYLGIWFDGQLSFKK